MLALTGAGCARQDPLLGFVCSGNNGIIAAGNVFRWVCLMLGIINSALYMRLLFDRRSKLLTGLAYRLGGAMLASYYIAVTEWDRIDDPITLRLPLGVAALLWLAIGMMKYKPPVTADDDIDARIARFERLRTNTPPPQ